MVQLFLSSFVILDSKNPKRTCSGCFALCTITKYLIYCSKSALESPLRQCMWEALSFSSAWPPILNQTQPGCMRNKLATISRFPKKQIHHRLNWGSQSKHWSPFCLHRDDNFASYCCHQTTVYILNKVYKLAPILSSACFLSSSTSTKKREGQRSALCTEKQKIKHISLLLVNKYFNNDFAQRWTLARAKTQTRSYSTYSKPEMKINRGLGKDLSPNIL